MQAEERTGFWKALGRLDRMIERATASADAAYGSGAAAEPYRGLYITTEDVKRMLARDPGAPVLAATELTGAGESVSGRLNFLTRSFQLDAFDTDALLIALAPEIDLRYERLYAYLQDDVTRRRPSVDLVLNLLCATRDAKVEARRRFATPSPLVRYRLIQMVPDSSIVHPPLLAHYLKIDDTVVRFLVGDTCLDARLSPFADLHLPAEPTQEATSRLAGLVRRALDGNRQLLVCFDGPAGTTKRAAAEAMAGQAGAPLLRANLAHMLSSNADFVLLSEVLFREARMHGAILYLEEWESTRASERMPQLAQLESLLRQTPLVVVLDCEKPWSIPGTDSVRSRLGFPTFTERRICWRQELDRHRLSLDASELDQLANRYRLASAQIAGAVRDARNQSELDDTRPGFAHFVRASLAQSARDLGPLARKVDPVYRWADIVLPPDQLALLREICDQARYRHVVYGDWGFDRKLSLGKGLSALFSGSPGTGKTMAAEVIANDLGLDLYKIDLSQVVSKYIGETEKNLNKLFAEAQSGNLILFFDECDALFGKRTEVRDAHDRYANLEIAYLLQKMDEHDGLCILATNFRQNLDPAFTRRITFSVEFPFPDELSRRRIWESIWPQEIPRAKNLDLDFMAAQFQLPGGSVKNIAVGAAFLAASEAAGEVRTEHLLRATRRELEKSGRTAMRSEFGRYASILDEPKHEVSERLRA